MYAACTPELRLVSNLAPGVDLIATDVASSMSYNTTAILPFPRAQYAAELASTETPSAQARSNAFLDACERPGLRVVELPELSERYEARAADAYALATRMIVDQVDILIAVWSGPLAEESRRTGPSLTRRGIELARQRNVPVLWLSVGPTRSDDDSRIGVNLESAFIGGSTWHNDDSGRSSLRDCIEALVDPYAGAPSASRVESRRKASRRWVSPSRVIAKLVNQLRGDDHHAPRPQLAESHDNAWLHVMRALEHGLERSGPSWTWRARLAMAQRSPFVWLEAHANRKVASTRSTPQHPASVLEEARVAAEQQSSDLMRLYRANFSWIFLLGAFAVLLAVSAYLLKPCVPWLGKSLAISEVAVVSTILWLHVGAHAYSWQQRAIDLRIVAEVLRQATWLSRCWLAIPKPNFGTRLKGRSEPPGWAQWYLQALLRHYDVGMSANATAEKVHRINRTDLSRVRDEIVAGLVVDQEQWYRRKAQIYSIMHTRLHRLELRIFVAVLFGCVASVVLAFVVPHDSYDAPWFHASMATLLAVCAVLPAFAAAIHGIAVQAELQRISSNYERTAAVLAARRRTLESLGADMTLDELRQEVRSASASMLAEVQDWQRSYGVHPPPLA